MNTPKELALAIAEFLYNKKGTDIQVLNVGHLTSITDYFVIASAHNTLQCKAMGEDLEEYLEENFQLTARRKEGYKEARWVVLDYSSVIVHIFHEQERGYYSLERLWADGTNLEKAY